ncbi:MAG: polysaccharide biosynthesis/export family protein [Candidatus Hatepunaea meridiana]|nr:polysaccharide biosynthesis/export family protein [Candidatus Hatepunaea meridiana]
MTISNNLYKQINWLGIVLLASLLLNTQPLWSATRIQPGHFLKITVSGHPEFTETVRVAQNGTTEYPLLADIPLDGLTAEDIKDLLRSALLRFDLEPDIFVVIAEEQVIKFQVFGEVIRPDRYVIEAPFNLQQALYLAGGGTETADLQHISILRIISGKRVKQQISLSDYSKLDSLVLPPEIRNNDIIIVPRLNEKLSVRVYGYTFYTGLYPVEPEDNVLDIIDKAGGFNIDADNKRVIHISTVNGRQVKSIINVYKAIQQGNRNELPHVMPGDIIIVPKTAEWRDIWFWIEKASKIAYLASLLVIINRAY